MNKGVIKVHDKFFRKFIPFEEIDKAVQKIADQLNHELKGKNPLFLGILNGAFMFTAELFKKLDFPCEISFVKLASYSGTSSTEMVRQLIGFDEDIKGRTIVIIEDIVDTGLTMESVLEQLNMMKPTAYLINVARGGIIDEEALKKALDGGKIAGAALDVYEEEPTKDMNLVGRPNVVCTPHIGAGSVEASRGNSTIVAEKLIKFLS